MPRVAVFDSGDHFDDPNLVYGPALEPPRRTMSDDNRISAVLSDADKTTILGHIAAIRTLMPFLINLTPIERKRLASLGDKTAGFDDKCADYMAQNPTLVPNFVDMTELGKDRALADSVMEVLREHETLTQSMDDTARLIGHEVYMAELSFYQSVRQGAKRGIQGA